ncbi:putative ATPase [Austwickia sp. TVS 96-490-7B]|nr:putative ATPase [Austwickia sp. TVS 96-490-7B]
MGTGGGGQREDWTQVRLHVVTGKGGTGKTSVAAALALALASTGRRVLVAEVEGRQGLCQVLDVPPLSTTEELVLRVSSGGEVWGVSVEAKAALLEYLEIFYHLGRAGRILEKVGAIDFATTIAPGVRDVLLVGKVYDAVRRQEGRSRSVSAPRWRYDAVVLDAPPTGRVGRFLGVNQEVADLARVGPVHGQANDITALLTSPSCAVHVVTLLEEMPVQEAADVIEELRASSVPVGAIIVNQARDPLLSEEDVAALSVAGPARADLVAALRGVGGPWDDAAVDALVTEGAGHAARMRLEDAQFAVVEGLGQPVHVLPPLRDGVDASGVRVLAQELTDQAIW